ncbi:MAG: SUMF1/EgtB/PvdO family nonheme iron enzyme, partial [Cytophagaceae bacterium]|nr:SUMF1/EgtB/PvdO family nonheme iron enzyme [Gemmatimonadaceae bacterium]
AERRAVASLPEIARLADEGRYADAHRLAQRAQGAIAGDTTLGRLMNVVEDRLTIVTRPEGAQAWLRRVVEDGSLAPDSVDAGLTPIRDLRLARGDYRVDLRKPGFMSEARIASSALNRAERSLGIPVEMSMEVPLRLESGAQRDMAFVPGSPYALVGRGAPIRTSVALPDYLIDAHEVTNEQFRAFVVAGGYAEAKFWREPFVLDGRSLPWDEARRRFVDRTGLPGPREWSGQDFPSGEGRRPVTGVSWYEAAAYAEYAGKRLPTIFEWEKAARDGRFTHFDQVVMPWGLSDPMRATSRRANFSGTGPEDVDSHPSGISPFGAYNMAGNVEEWAANATGGRRFITGGAWDDPMYVFANFLSVSPWHASPSLGFRCVRTVPGATGDPGAFDIPVGNTTPVYRPVDEATHATLLRHYAYDRLPLDAHVVDTVTTPDWTRETIAIAGPWRDRTTLYLYLPLRTRRPLQTIVFLPGTNTFLDVALPDETAHLMGAHVKAGRAVLAVHFKGMVGRPWDDGRRVPATSSVQYAQEFIMHATELRRAIDYLETRPDIDVSRLAYIGFSRGSGAWIPFAAVEPRFRSVVFIGGGIDETFLPARPEVRNISFASHIRAPTLLLNGEYDEEHPWDRRGLPLWSLLREPRRLEIVKGGHLPPAEVRVPAINRWLDETLGPVR